MSQLAFRISAGVLLTTMFILLLVIIGQMIHSVPTIIQPATSATKDSGSNPGFLIVLAIYFLPGLVAHFRGHHNKSAIFLLNLLLGWTVLGWIVSLVWSATNPAKAI